MRKALPLFILLVAGLAAVLYWQLTLQQAELERPSGGSATLEGDEVVVAARLSSRLAAVYVDEGDAVSAGQLVAELDCSEPNAVLAEADAAVAAATEAVDLATTSVDLARNGELLAGLQTSAADASTQAAKAQRGVLEVQKDAAARELARAQKLAEGGSTTAQNLDRAKDAEATVQKQLRALDDQVEAARAQKAVVAQQGLGATLQVTLAEGKVRAAEADLERVKAARGRALVAVGECKLYAPRAGVVQTRALEPGEVVLPGSRVLVIVDASVVHARFYLPNAELAAAKLGGAVEVVADALPERVFEGRIRRIASSAEFTPRNVQTRQDRDRLVFAVDVDIPNPQGELRPGMSAEVSIPGSGGSQP